MTFDYLLKVSHHPPISACHADSNKFTFLQGTLPVELQCHTHTSSMRSWFFIVHQDGTLMANSADFLLRRQMEKQILGEIHGNPTHWHSQCYATKVIQLWPYSSATHKHTHTQSLSV